ncbi:MAG: type II secretion system F family protein [Phycisphaerae bacterium]|nr:type II secretion system F family protein [Phycisphaerae bacterium]
MALFEYRSVTTSGRLMTGTIEAADIEQAKASLAEMNVQVTELEKTKESATPKSIGHNEFVLFNEQLASLTKAGIPLEQGLRELAHDAGSSKMRSLINSIADELERGTPIDEAVGKHQKDFPPLYGLILKSGVETGRLSEMLTNLNRHLQVELRTKRIIVESLTYPAVVLVAAALIVTGLLLLIIPTFAEVLSDMSDGKAGLPYLTQFVLDMSTHVWDFWLVIGVIAVVFAFIWKSMAFSAAGRKTKERFFRSLPLMGRVFRNGSMARFSECMSVLINAGCTLDDAVELSGQSSSSELLKQDCGILAAQLKEGSNFLEAGMGCKTIPRLFLYSVQLGAQRNELKENLNSLGRMYAAKTFSLQSQMQGLMEPLLIILLGGLVGTIVLAMFLPMVKMIQVLM